jgi:vacuolar protein sorting-associated protein IST1
MNFQIIEKLSVRAPPGDVKLKLMKEIATEHDVDWDATESEAELLKTHEDLLVSGLLFDLDVYCVLYCEPYLL